MLLVLKTYTSKLGDEFFFNMIIVDIFFLLRDRVSRPTSVFDRNGFDPFARSRRNSLSKKSKMKQMKQQVTPSLVKQADYSQVGRLNYTVVVF